MISEYCADYRHVQPQVEIRSKSEEAEEQVEPLATKDPLFPELSPYLETYEAKGSSNGIEESIEGVEGRKFHFFRGAIFLTLALIGMIFVCYNVNSSQINNLIEECFKRLPF